MISNFKKKFEFYIFHLDNENEFNSNKDNISIKYMKTNK